MAAPDQLVLVAGPHPLRRRDYLWLRNWPEDAEFIASQVRFAVHAAKDAIWARQRDRDVRRRHASQSRPNGGRTSGSAARRRTSPQSWSGFCGTRFMPDV